MNGPRVIWEMIAILVAAGIVAGLVLATREPEYQGRGLSAWLNDLTTQTPEVRDNAKAALQQMHPSPAPFLVRRLQVKDSPMRRLLERLPLIRLRSAQRTRMQGVQGLLALGPAAKAVVPDLEKLVSEPQIGRDVVRILRLMGPEGTPALVAAYTNAPPPNAATSPRDRVSQEVAHLALTSAIGAAGTNAAAAVPALLKDLNSTDRSVRCEAVLALGNIGTQDKAVRVALLERRQDSDETVRRNAAMALAGLNRQASGKILRDFHKPDFDPLQYADGLSPADPVVVSALRKMAERDPEFHSRQSATYSLLTIDPKATLEAFTRNLSSPDLEVRRNSARNFVYFKKGGLAAVPALVKCLADADDTVQQNAAVALREIGAQPEMVVPALTKMLDGANAKTQIVCAIALGGFGEAAKPAVPKIIDILKRTTDQFEGQAVFMALNRIDPEAASRFQQEGGAGWVGTPAPQTP
jgi:HEAT repeat protein